jgi:hypothetical protein
MIITFRLQSKFVVNIVAPYPIVLYVYTVILKNHLGIEIGKKAGVLTLMISQLSPLELVKAIPPQNLLLIMCVWELNLTNYFI